MTKIVYNQILSLFLKYLPSRLLVILNSLVIVPFFAYMLTEKEMGIFQLSIGILNLVCTISTDWIAKSALRFYEKHKHGNFYSNIFMLMLASYAVIILLYTIFNGLICEKFHITGGVLALTLLLVIPCGIRQFLYQMLRIFKKPFLYTFSIVIYQLVQVFLFLLLSKVFDNVTAVLAAMTLAMLGIDAYIVKKIYHELTETPTAPAQDMLHESLRYSLPLIVTNTGIWMIFHVNKFIFQNLKQFDFTAVSGVSWLYTTYILTPLFSTFLFAVFPLVIKRFETDKEVKSLITSTVQLYCALFIPLTCAFIFYSAQIAQLAFGGKYTGAGIILPFFALTLFLHELMKILNIKYHLKNRTYIEMLISVAVAIMCLGFNLFLIPHFGLLGAGLSMLLSIILLIAGNSVVNFKSLQYISFPDVSKTVFYTAAITATGFAVSLIFPSILKIIVFLLLNYAILWQYRRKILS